MALLMVSLALARAAILSCTSGSVMFTAPDKKPGQIIIMANYRTARDFVG